MRFVQTKDLVPGMRLAKPIYNKKGVMLYERDSKLTGQGITSIENFGLIGIYILEPAEPLPPFTDEDREFEKFQTVGVFKLKEILDNIRMGKNPTTLESLVAEIMQKFGNRQERMNFIQNLRSFEDNVYKHSLNVAILSALITGKMTMTRSEQKSIVTAALLHDIGSLDVPMSIFSKSNEEMTDVDIDTIIRFRDNGYRIIRDHCDFDSDIMRNISYLLRDLKELDQDKRESDSRPKDMCVEVLKVAYVYDIRTAMKYGSEPESDIAAYKYLHHPKNRMNQQVVKALTYAINIVPSGCSVQFENGTKGIVVAENPNDILRPFILSFSDNRIYNLGEGKVFEQYQIKDVMKTLDNRYIMTDKYDSFVDQMNSGELKVLKVGK